ncbi:hypothetical protein QJS10_CPB11g00578 [Acorus calamus]|uniref:Dihydrodipicolinate reductase C-terminal domain-containing protein n=1 Tax=Acorus calamus TaxID=4465 RepID=A0AAV9DTN7_ACOCL|nr:hypothetical protein QJS10_CPB11g00578 [Acorus calamus]
MDNEPQNSFNGFPEIPISDQKPKKTPQSLCQSHHHLLNAALSEQYQEVIINGATNEIGKATVVAVTKARGMEVAGAVDTQFVGQDIGKSKANGVVVHLTEPSTIYDDVKQDLPTPDVVQIANNISNLGQMYNREDLKTDVRARGQVLGNDGVRVHSLVLPGLSSSTSVHFSGPGEVYNTKHDITNVQCLMPGLLIAKRKVVRLKAKTPLNQSLGNGGQRRVGQR